MTPSDLRAAADRIADVYTIQDADAATWRAMVHVVDAARRLADVIEASDDLAQAQQYTSYCTGMADAAHYLALVATGKDQT